MSDLRWQNRLTVLLTFMLRYFETRNGARSGSFVRLEKLESGALAPCTILEALLRKYGSGQEAESQVRHGLSGGGRLISP